MKNEDDIKLKVCKECDAPLPCDALNLSYFNLNSYVCDDCFKKLS